MLIILNVKLMLYMYLKFVISLCVDIFVALAGNGSMQTTRLSAITNRWRVIQNPNILLASDRRPVLLRRATIPRPASITHHNCKSFHTLPDEKKTNPFWRNAFTTIWLVYFCKYKYKCYIRIYIFWELRCV